VQARRSFACLLACSRARPVFEGSRIRNSRRLGLNTRFQASWYPTWYRTPSASAFRATIRPSTRERIPAPPAPSATSGRAGHQAARPRGQAQGHAGAAEGHHVPRLPHPPTNDRRDGSPQSSVPAGHRHDHFAPGGRPVRPRHHRCWGLDGQAADSGRCTVWKAELRFVLPQYVRVAVHRRWTCAAFGARTACRIMRAGEA
jgi:hypothetical protein